MAESSVSVQKLLEGSNNYQERNVVFQNIVKGGCYEIKIENVYDPSKFWIIVKFKELVIFMKYLKYFYDKMESKKAIPKSHLKTYMMCVARRSGMYYRSIILPILLPDGNLVRVFMIDFGYIVNVDLKDIFHIAEKHRLVPRFAIRASLAYISPLGQSNTWSLTDLKTFCEIIASKRIFAKVCEIDTERRVLFTEIHVVSGLDTKSVNKMLVDSKVAIYNKGYENTNFEPATKYKSKVKYPYLFPSFEALENGTVPCSLWEFDLLKHSVPLDLLCRNYYVYQEN